MPINRSWVNLKTNFRVAELLGLRTEVPLSTDSSRILLPGKIKLEANRSPHCLSQRVLANQFLWANSLFNFANNSFVSQLFNFNLSGASFWNSDLPRHGLALKFHLASGLQHPASLSHPASSPTCPIVCVHPRLPSHSVWSKLQSAAPALSSSPFPSSLPI